jgi:hypothetical protein
MSSTTKALNANLLVLVGKERAADTAVNTAFNQSNEAIDANNTAANKWLDAGNNLKNVEAQCSVPKPSANCPQLIAAAKANVTAMQQALSTTSATATKAKAAVAAAQAELKSAEQAYQTANTAAQAEIKEMQATITAAVAAKKAADANYTKVQKECTGGGRR